MSKDKNPGGNTDDSGGDGGNKDTVSLDSHNKLLGEKKKLQKEFDDLKGRLDALEQEKLEQSGNLKEQVEKLKGQLAESREKHLKTTKLVSEKVVKAQFMREAEKLGCVDAELAFKTMDMSSLNVGEDFEFDSKALVGQLQNFAKDKPFLFNKQVDPPRDGGNPPPASKPGVTTETKGQPNDALWAQLKN
ncbi:MAG: hypothetical protein J7501_03850 [Bdellovibrio sp.]|nr:hypothetical protein [Bdellovibrio sp.]